MIGLTPNSSGAVLATAIGLAVAFAALAVWAGVHPPALDRLDRELFLLLRGDGPPPGGPSVVEAIRDVTALGSFTATGVVLVLVAGGLMAHGHRGHALWLAATIISGVLLTMGVKELIARPRPDLAAMGPHVATLSFPSGHAAKAVLLLGAVAAVIVDLTENAIVRRFTLASAAVLIVAVGASRVYLGVHWPSDVVGGWMLGLAWVLGSWLVAVRVLGGTGRGRDPGLEGGS